MTESLYRKYRPQTFDDVVGQSVIIKTLKNAISNNKLAHAYLFTGSRGTGKTTTARILAKTLLCENAPTDCPDGTCEECKLIAESRHPDVLELDAASRTGVDNVREEIISRVKYAPARGNYKVYIIDEVHMLSTAAFNALLKTLEEPPDKVIFILCTTDPQKVPETIHSRCQRFDFRRISIEELTAHLGAVCNEEGVEFEGDALDLIARRSNGGMRDALSTLEQIIVFGEGKVTLSVAQDLLGSISVSSKTELSVAIVNRDVKSAISIIRDAVEDGVDLAQFSDDVAWFFRDVYVYKLAGEAISLNTSKPDESLIEKMSEALSEDRLIYILSNLGNLSREIKSSSNQQLTFEIALSKLFAPENSITLSALAERISNLESGNVNVYETNISVESLKTQPVKTVVENVQPIMTASTNPPVTNHDDSPNTEPETASQGNEESSECILGAPFKGGHIVGSSEKTIDRTPNKPDIMKSTGIKTSTASSVVEASIKTMDANVDAATNISATNSANLSQLDKFNSDCVRVLCELLILNRSFYFLICKDARFSYDAKSNLVKVVLPSNKNFVYGNVNKPAFKERLKTAFGNIGYLGVSVEVVKDDILFSELSVVDTSAIDVENSCIKQVNGSITPASTKAVQPDSAKANIENTATPFVATTISPVPAPAQKVADSNPEISEKPVNVSAASQNATTNAKSNTSDTCSVDRVSTESVEDDFDTVPFEVYESQVIDSGTYIDDEIAESNENTQTETNEMSTRYDSATDHAKPDEIDEMNRLLSAKFGNGLSFKYKE